MSFEKFNPTHIRVSAANFDALPFEKFTPAYRFLEWMVCGAGTESQGESSGLVGRINVFCLSLIQPDSNVWRRGF